MKIALTYQGSLPGLRASALDIWPIRRSFESQLRRIWGQPPLDMLKDWVDSGERIGCVHGPDRDFRIARGSKTFIPLVSSCYGLAAELRVRILEGSEPRKSLITGDVDNRVKKLVDALCPPRQPTGNDTQDAETLLCVLEDDSLVRRLEIERSPFLRSEGRDDALALIDILIVSGGATSLDMLGMIG